LGDPGIDGRIIKMNLLQEVGCEVWTGLSRLRTGAGGGHL